MRGKGKTNLKHVAQAAGISPAAVSRFLNGTLTLPIATRTRIDKAIKALNYEPNPHARRLRRGRSDTIGLVLPDIANPFFATLVAAVEEEADKRGFGLSIHATLNRSGREVAYVNALSRNHIDGLLFITNHPDDGTLARLINQTGKVVIADEDVPQAITPKLFSDNEQGGYLAGCHLADHGHRDVAYIGGPKGMISTVRRSGGLERALRERGLPYQLYRYDGDYTVEFGRQAARRFLDDNCPASAILAGSDEIAIGLIEVFRAQNITIPDDVSLIGFDDIEPLHLFNPPLTAIRQQVRLLGQKALALLLETNWEEKGATFSEQLLPVEIKLRQSVGAPSRRFRVSAGSTPKEVEPDEEERTSKNLIS